MNNLFSPPSQTAHQLSKTANQILAELRTTISNQLPHLTQTAHTGDLVAAMLNTLVAFQSFIRRGGQTTSLPLAAQLVGVTGEYKKTLTSAI